MFSASRTVAASAIMIAISAPAVADTIYLECTVPPASAGIPMLGGMTCNQVPSHLILRLPDTSRSEQPVAQEAEAVAAPEPAAEPVVETAIPVPNAEEKPAEGLLEVDPDPEPAPAAQESREEEKPVERPPVDAEAKLVTTPAVSATYGPIRPGESISRIAATLFPKDTRRIDEVVAAFVHLNPSAFIQGDPDKIKAGVTLKVPAPEEIGSAPRAVQKERRPEPAEKPVVVSPAPAKPEPQPGILVLPGGASPKPEPVTPVIIEPAAPVAAPTAPAATEPKAAAQSTPASAPNDDAKKALMQKIEAIRKQMLELNSELQEKSGGG